MRSADARRKDPSEPRYISKGRRGAQGGGGLKDKVKSETSYQLPFVLAYGAYATPGRCEFANRSTGACSDFRSSCGEEKECTSRCL